MKRYALYFSARRRVRVQEEGLSQPGPGEVLVQTIVSAISPGTELLLYFGQAPPKLPADETIDALSGSLDFPFKYGYAAVGRVIALGAGVPRHWQDELVFAFNPHESHFVAKTATLLPVPASIEPETAAFLPNMETAVSLVMDARPVIGEQVAVFGQGVVGLLTTMLLAQMPLSSLVTLDRHRLRRRFSISAGAQASFDPEEPEALARLAQILRGRRPYAGADLCFELSGNPEALDQAIAVTGYDGRIVIGSWYGRRRSALDLGGKFHRSHIKLVSSQVSQLAPRWRGRWSKLRRYELAWAMLRTHHPAHLITHRLPIHRADEAYSLLAETPDQTVQVLLTYEGTS